METALFSHGAAIRQKGGDRWAGRFRAASIGFRLDRSTATAFAGPLDPDPKSLRQNDSISP